MGGGAVEVDYLVIGTYLNNAGPAIDNLATLRAELGEVADL